MAWESKYPEYPNLMDAVIGRIQSGNLDKGDDLTVATFMALFCIQAESGKVEERLLNYISKRFWCILAGAPWEEQFPLPEREPPEDWGIRSPKERRDRSLFSAVLSLALNGEKQTDALWKVAKENNLSFEAVRGIFYAEKKKLGITKEILSKFGDGNLE